MLADVLGQAEVAEKFLNARKKDKLAQAYILAGPDGIGKTPFAIELAKTLLCQKKANDACELCPSCRKVQHGNHEDIEILEPAGAGNIIAFEMVNELIEKLRFKTRGGEHRFVILREADRMREETANHFLKTLEEPPTDVTFFLLTARLPALLETIVSRCQIVRMHRAAAGEIERFLVKRGIDADRARLYARLADGCTGRAVSMEESGVFDRRRRVLKWVSELDRDTDLIVAGEMLEENRGKTPADTRDGHYADLGLMASLYRDMTLIAEGAEASLLYNPDAADRLRPRAQKTGPGRLRAQTLEIIEARRKVERFVNPDLVISRLFDELVK